MGTSVIILNVLLCLFPAVDVKRVGPEVLNVVLDSTHSSEDTSLLVIGDDSGAANYTVTWTHLKEDGTFKLIIQEDADPEKYTLYVNKAYGNYSSEFSASLTIHNTELDDSGYYICTVSTIHHTSQATFEVRIYYGELLSNVLIDLTPISIVLGCCIENLFVMFDVAFWKFASLIG